MNYIYRQTLIIGTLKTVFFLGSCTISLIFIQIIIGVSGISQEIYRMTFIPILIFIVMFFVSVFVHVNYRTKHHEIKDLFH